MDRIPTGLLPLVNIKNLLHCFLILLISPDIITVRIAYLDKINLVKLGSGRLVFDSSPFLPHPLLSKKWTLLQERSKWLTLFVLIRDILWSYICCVLKLSVFQKHLMKLFFTVYISPIVTLTALPSNTESYFKVVDWRMLKEEHFLSLLKLLFLYLILTFFSRDHLSRLMWTARENVCVCACVRVCACVCMCVLSVGPYIYL